MEVMHWEMPPRKTGCEVRLGVEEGQAGVSYQSMSTRGTVGFTL